MVRERETPKTKDKTLLLLKFVFDCDLSLLMQGSTAVVCCPPVQEVAVEEEEDAYYSYDEGEEEEVSRDVLKALTHNFTKKKASSSTLYMYTRTVYGARPNSFVHLPGG